MARSDRRPSSAPLAALNKPLLPTASMALTIHAVKNPMSLAVLRSRALAGMDAPAVSVEVHLAKGLPSFTIIGTEYTIFL